MKKANALLLFFVILASALCVLCACDKDDACEHSFGEWQVTQQATCTQDGEEERKCSLCGKTETRTVDALGHTGGQATCEQQAICDRCGKPYGELAEHVLGAFAVTVEATCTQNGERRAECSVCGHPVTEAIPAKGHSGEWKVVAEPRCFDDGERQRICTVCDELEEEAIPAYGQHDLKDATCVGGKECTRCNYVEGDGKGHVFGEWTATQPATCTENGIEARRCLICGDEQTRTLLKTGHSGEWETVEAPTCTTNGTEGRYCTECGMFESRTAYRTGHTGEWVEIVAANCTENGYSERTCLTCGLTERKTLYAGHVYGDWWETVAPTCTETGYERRFCINCGSQQDREVAKIPHTGEWTVIVQPTCTENGAKMRTCEVCGQGENAVVEKLGHEMSAGSCTEPSVCARCGYTEYGGHVYDEGYVIIDPDCERHGIVWQTCTVCGHVEEIFTQQNGHTLGDWSVIKEPTCIEQGKERCFCSVCDKAFDRAVETIDHIMGEWVTTKEATCTREGERVRKCTMCDYIETEKVQKLAHTIVPATCTTDEKCSLCGYVVSKAPGHEYGETGCVRCNVSFAGYLTYELTDDGAGYRIVRCRDDFRQGELLVPDTYNGKPVLEIGNGAFSSLKFTSLYIPKSIVSIGNEAFPSDIESVFFEEGSALENIGDNAFSCYKLKEIKVPEGVKRIGRSAFSQVEVVYLPAGIEYIGQYAVNFGVALCADNERPSGWEVEWTTNGSRVYWGVGEETSVNIDGVLYVVAGENAVVAKAEDWVKEVEIPEKVAIGGKEYVVGEIGLKAFAGCSSLKSVVIAHSIKEIGDFAFANCESLTSFFIPKEVAIVGDNMFEGCKGLDKIYCEAESCPEQWVENWNWNNGLMEIVWGASEEDVAPAN